jgi:asparagine synthase (glutamine-hydrolysing)
MAGQLNFDGKPVNREFLGKLGASVAQYGPDNADVMGRGGPGEYIEGPFAMIYRPFHTSSESRLECQPYVSKRGNIMTWDGRLDNRGELLSALSDALTLEHRREHTDVAIVMAAWEAWGTECLKRLIGDFALAIWEPNSRTLTLAKDFIGVRHLYYELLPEGVRGGTRSDPELGDVQLPSGPCFWWCSRLEPLILLSGRQYEINEKYIAGYFAFHPANHLTPYVGVDALPAGHYVQIRNGQKKLVPYWHFDSDKRITYRTDAEYEEHFRELFFQSVKRRLRADAPVVAGLSGGRDSSAIVCVADELIARGEAECPRLDTYSRYDEEEPFGNDKPYLTIVEQKRGRIGYHFTPDSDESVSSSATTRLRLLTLDFFSAHPGGGQANAEAVQKRMKFMQENGYRIILSGMGGDEVTGGVPYCISELADLLVERRFIRFMAQLKNWSLAQKRTWTNLGWNVAKSLEPELLRRVFWNRKRVWPWIDANFLIRQFEAFIYGTRLYRPREGLPSFRTNVEVATGVSWELASAPKLHRQGVTENCYDRGFPFLDRDFLEFLFAIPRAQVMRPGQYRSLMRRALAGIVPSEILNRTRKAFAARRPALKICSIAEDARELFSNPLTACFGYVNRNEFLRTLDAAISGKSDAARLLRLVVTLEMWLRSLGERGLLKNVPALQEKALESVA